MLEPDRRSPLHHRTEISAEEAAHLRELPFQGKIVLRGDAGSIGEAAADVLGAQLPVEPCGSALGANLAILWIGPDEWWIITEAGVERDTQARLSVALQGRHHQTVDVTDYYTTIEVAGLRVIEMLSKLTTLDLHRRAFPLGRVAGSMFAQTQATLWHAGSDEYDSPSFRLFVRWTTADYLWCLLAEAGREFGLPVQEPLAGETWRLAR